MDVTTSLGALFFIFISFTFFIDVYYKRKRFNDIINKIPGPKSYPLIGTAYRLIKPRTELFAFFQQEVKKFKPFFRTWLGSEPEVHFIKPEHIEVVLSSSENIAKGRFYSFLHPWLGMGLLTSKGKLWHDRRKLLTPAFHFKILDDFLEIFVEKGQKLSEVLMERNNRDAFDLYPYVNKCALDIICATAMGVEVNAMDNSNTEYVNAILDMGELVMKRALKPWLHSDFIFKKTSFGKKYYKTLSILHNFTIKVMNERREMLKMNKFKKISEEDLLLGKKQRLAFLDLLLEASKGGTVLTDTDIREEVDTFMFEGHDTTTVAISFCLFLVGNHPDVQEKIHEELDDIFGDDRDRPITMADLGEMKYLERVVKESLRIYPSVPFITRCVTHPFEIDGYLVPAGTSASIHIYDVHRDETNFPNPDNFDPDNFLPERCKTRHPFAFIPFSAGPRNCIGQKFAMMEEKILMAYVLRKFKIKSLQTPEELKLFAELVLRPQDGIQVVIEARY